MRHRLAIFLIFAFALSAQQPKYELTLDNIMRGAENYGYAPRDVRWQPDGKRVFFAWKEHTEALEKDFDTWSVDRDGKNLRRLTDEEKKDAPPSNGRWTRDRMRALYAEDGDIYLYDGATNKRRNLTKTTDGESSPRWTQDEKHVAFVRGNNLYVLTLGDGSIEQVTNIVTADEKGPNVDLWQDKDKSKSASQLWVEKEERKLIDTVDRRAKKREADEAKKKKENPRKPFKLEGKQNVADLQLTPDGKGVLAFLRTEGAKTKRTIVPDYVTESGYTESIPGRTKVGDDAPMTKLVRLDVANGESKPVDFGLPVPPETKEKKSEVPQEKDKSDETKGEGAKEGAKAKTRDIGIEEVVWSDDGSKGVLVLRATDNKDRWILALDQDTARTRILFSEHDDAWVNNFRSAPVDWLKDNATIYFVSEQTGYAHLYTLPYAGGTPKALTEGKWEVLSVDLSRDGKSFELLTSETTPYEHHFWRVPVTGGARTQLTSTPGFHDVAASPDGTMLADIYSYTNKPPEVYLQAATPKAPATRVTTSPSALWQSYPWLDVPIVGGVTSSFQQARRSNVGMAVGDEQTHPVDGHATVRPV